MNELRHEKSPYLLQHADNPVAWRPWGQPAFDAAQSEDKPIFLSIGYSTCHWCHVMAHESFEDPAAAEAINRDFIPIKVDREERPDVDAVYMSACTAMNGSGGWPLTVLLTPDRKPFWAGTYLPRAQLLSLLDKAAALWRENRSGVLEAGDALTEHLRQERVSAPGKPRRELLESGVSQLAAGFDAAWGGFGHAPKFPAAHNLIFLMRYARLTGNGHARHMAETTLEHMYRGGIFDHIGGGFSRYSTDRRWLVPHFEKMLYDNALLALAYTEAFEHTGRFIYQTAARRTLDYILRELSDPEGGFFCGQDADSDGAEGKYYLLSPDELTAALGAETAQKLCARFDIASGGNFEGKSIPNLIGAADWESEPDWESDARRTVYACRRERTRLRRDDKILTAWNGLAIAAMARAGFVLNEARYIEAGTRAVEFIRAHLTDADGRLLARWRDGDAAHTGKLEDYTYYIWGLLELYGATFQTNYLEDACRLTDILLGSFFDRESGGFYPYPAEGEQLIARTRETYDGALPSGNSVAALVLSRLVRLTGRERLREAATLHFRYLAGAAADYPAGRCFALLAMLEELWPTAELICAAQTIPEELVSFLRREPRPNLTVLVKTSENAQKLAELAPFTKEYPCPPSGAKYYLCRGGACLAPADSTEALDRLMRQDAHGR